jgi:hypothetical protein
MLGHQDAAMTLNVYASLFEDDLDAVPERLDAAIARAAVSWCVLAASRPFLSSTKRKEKDLLAWPNGWRPQQDSNLRHKV